jgi:hypothetical protein
LKFNDLPRYAKEAYRAARRRAIIKNIQIISEEEFVGLWIQNDGTCRISGLHFSEEQEDYAPETGYARLKSRPWEPSLDQITAGLGYSLENSQLVCKCVNIGKSGYSENTFGKWVLATASKMEMKRSVKR